MTTSSGDGTYTSFAVGMVLGGDSVFEASGDYHPLTKKKTHQKQATVATVVATVEATVHGRAANTHRVGKFFK